MSNFVIVKTSYLTDDQLIWATGKALGLDIRNTGSSVWVHGDVPNTDTPGADYYPLCWEQGGPLTSYAVEMCKTAEGPWMAVVPSEIDGTLAREFHDSLLVALCRAIVAAKLGDQVCIPAELVEGAV